MGEPLDYGPAELFTREDDQEIPDDMIAWPDATGLAERTCNEGRLKVELSDATAARKDNPPIMQDHTGIY